MLNGDRLLCKVSLCGLFFCCVCMYGPKPSLVSLMFYLIICLSRTKFISKLTLEAWLIGLLGLTPFLWLYFLGIILTLYDGISGDFIIIYLIWVI